MFCRQFPVLGPGVRDPVPAAADGGSRAAPGQYVRLVPGRRGGTGAPAGRSDRRQAGRVVRKLGANYSERIKEHQNYG